MSENQAVDNSLLRPGLIVVTDNNVIIIDITVTFEDEPEAFRITRPQKLEKYAELKSELLKKYDSVDLDAIVVGSLGSWDVDNDKPVRRLCSKKYATVMRKLIVSEMLRASRNIYSRSRKSPNNLPPSTS